MKIKGGKRNRDGEDKEGGEREVMEIRRQRKTNECVRDGHGDE